MDDPLRPARDVQIPQREVVLRASRSSGPGGQHANVTASRVEASFDVAASSALSEEQKARVMARCGPSCAPSPRTRAARCATASSRCAASRRGWPMRSPCRGPGADAADGRLARGASRPSAARANASGPGGGRARGTSEGTGEGFVEDGDRWGAGGHRPTTTARPGGLRSEHAEGHASS